MSITTFSAEVACLVTWRTAGEATHVMYQELREKHEHIKNTVISDRDLGNYNSMMAPYSAGSTCRPLKITNQGPEDPRHERVRRGARSWIEPGKGKGKEKGKSGTKYKEPQVPRCLKR